MEKAWNQWLDGYHRKLRGLRSCPCSGVKFLLPPVSVNIPFSVSAQQQQKRVHLSCVRGARRRAFAQLGTDQRQSKCFSASLLLVAASQLRLGVWLSVNLDYRLRALLGQIPASMCNDDTAITVFLAFVAKKNLPLETPDYILHTYFYQGSLSNVCPHVNSWYSSKSKETYI